MSKRIFLNEKDQPTAWYNLQADLPKPVPPPLNPGTQQPLGPADLEPIFARALIQQEMSCERWIEIPEEVRRVYAIWRPVAPGAGAGVGKGPQNSGPHLFQGRKPQSAGQP